MGLPPWSTTLNGHDSTSFLTMGSSNRRPISRLRFCQHLFPSFQQSLNPLDIEDSVFGVHGSLIFGGLANEALFIGEGDEGRGGEATLLVGNCDMDKHALSSKVLEMRHTDFDIVAIVVCDAGVSGT